MNRAIGLGAVEQGWAGDAVVPFVDSDGDPVGVWWPYGEGPETANGALRIVYDYDGKVVRFEVYRAGDRTSPILFCASTRHTDDLIDCLKFVAAWVKLDEAEK